MSDERLALIARYHALLSEGDAPAEWAQMQAGMADRHLTFGSRPICTVLRPLLVTRRDYDAVQRASTLLFGALTTLYRWLMSDDELRRQAGLPAVAEAALHVEPGYDSPDGIGRLDGFFTTEGQIQFVEYNADSPGGLLFGHELAELFEPFQGVARVGYEACQSDDAWEIAMFLGEKELVGGAADGRMVPVNFRFDIKGISNCFTQVTGVFWNAFPNSHVCFDGAADLSFLTVDGLVNGNAIRLQLHATPPDCVGPAMREHIDGRLELV